MIDVHPTAEQQQGQVTWEKQEHSKVKAFFLNYSVTLEEIK